jgi:hypothetical protein
MRTLAALTLALVASLVAAGTAAADHHLMRVNEVLLSSGGDTSKQFVELLDSADEPFPTAKGPYELACSMAPGQRLRTRRKTSAIPFRISRRPI